MSICQNCKIESFKLDSNNLCFDCRQLFYDFLKDEFKPLCDCINKLANTKNGAEYTDCTIKGSELLLKINDKPKFMHKYFEKQLRMSVIECLSLFEKNIDFINATDDEHDLTDKLASRKEKKEINTEYIC